MSEQQGQLTTTSVQETRMSACPHPEAVGKRWGDDISEERKGELKALAERQRAWVARGTVGQHEGMQSAVKGIELTAADAFYLACLALAGADGDIAKAEARLRTSDLGTLDVDTEDLEPYDVYYELLDEIVATDLSAVHLEGAILREAHLEGVKLYRAHFDGADLRFAHLERANLSEVHLAGAILYRAHLEQADLEAAHLEGVWFHEAHLEGARLLHAHLEGAHLNPGPLLTGHGARLEKADLSWAHLEGADFSLAHLEGARLNGVHLERACLFRARLQGARLNGAHLEGADLRETHLEGADLRASWLDSQTQVTETVITHTTTLGDIQWSGVGAVNLTQIDWTRVSRLGDEEGRGLHFSPLADLEAIVRAYRQLATQLRAQGMSEVADRFAYRAQVRQRRVYLHRFRILQFFGSWFLDLISGYGYKPMRSFIAYAVVIFAFAAAYLTLGGANGQPLTWNEAIVISMTAFHGRGFFSAVFQPGDLQAAVAAAEAFIGLLIEIVFIATFTQRFFAR